MPDKFDEVAREIEYLYLERWDLAEVAAILRRHFGVRFETPTESDVSRVIAMGDELKRLKSEADSLSPEPLDKPDRVGWWEGCTKLGNRFVLWWDGQSLHDSPGTKLQVSLENYSDFRPLVHAGESEQPTTEARP